MSNDGNFDLSGVFHVQKNYLTDLKDSYPDVNNAPKVVKYVLDLQNKTKDLDASFANANTSAKAVLTQQNEMIDIVNKEQGRLTIAKDLTDQSESSEERKILLTNSNRLLYEEYTKIILCVVAGLIINIALQFGAKLWYPVSGSAGTGYILLHILNIIVWMIIILKIYMKIQSRSQINFNEINLPPPEINSEHNISPASANYNNLFQDLGLCYSEHCCGEGTVWDKQLGSCVNIVNESPVVVNESPVVVNESPAVVNESPAVVNESPAEGFSDTCGCSEEPEIKEPEIKEPEIEESSNDTCGCSGESGSKELSNENVLNTHVKLSFSNIEQAYQNNTISTPYTDLDKSVNQNKIDDNNQYIGMDFNNSKFADFK